MTQRAHQPREAGPALLLTGERRFGRYLVALRGHELLITYTHYNLLVELLLAKRDPLSAGYAAAGAYPKCRAWPCADSGTRSTRSSDWGRG